MMLHRHFENKEPKQDERATAKPKEEPKQAEKPKRGRKK